MIQAPATLSSLTTEFKYILRHRNSLAAPIIGFLDLYFCLWKWYVVDSALKIRLEEGQCLLQMLIEWLTTECDALR